MKPIMILLTMFFCHIVDDYYLQGWLASAKQKIWWGKNAPNELYKFDYIMALIVHSFSWTFMIMLPIVLVSDWSIGWLVFAYPINMVVHAVVDDLKANKGKINLIIDQSIHFIQIVLTFIIYLLLRR
jgi:hypothetical protein